MRQVFKNRFIYGILLLTIIIAFYFSINIKENFLTLYLAYLCNISIRYFLIIISVIIECFVWKLFHNPTIITRYGSKQNHLYKKICIEGIIAALIFIIFNFIIIVSNFSLSLIHLIDIGITIMNFIIIYFVISLLIKLIDCFVNNHFFSSVIFIFIFACFDFLLEHFNFFFINNSFFDLRFTYTIYYDYGLIYLLFFSLISIMLFVLLSFYTFKNDYIIKKSENDE